MHRSDSTPAATGAAIEPSPAGRPQAILGAELTRPAETTAGRPVCVTVWEHVDTGLVEAFDAVIRMLGLDGGFGGLLEVSRPGRIRTSPVPPEGMLRLGVRGVEGRYVLARSERGGTVIRWTVAFQPRRGARPLVRALAPLQRRRAARELHRIATAP